MECLKIEEMIHLIVPFALILKHGLINRAAVAPNFIHFLTVMGTILNNSVFVFLAVCLLSGSLVSARLVRLARLCDWRPSPV